MRTPIKYDRGMLDAISGGRDSYSQMDPDVRYMIRQAGGYLAYKRFTSWGKFFFRLLFWGSSVVAGIVVAIEKGVFH